MEPSLQLVRAVMDDFPAAIFIEDGGQKIIYHNRAASWLPGGAAEAHVTFSAAESQSSYEIAYHGKWYVVSAIRSHWENDAPITVRVAFDVTDLKQSQVKFMQNATMDAMTGIFNRQSGIDFLAQYNKLLQNGGEPFTVCFIDLNGLKEINDNYGHLNGDFFIITVVDVIKRAVRQTDIFARMGGDEFLILFPQCHYPVVENIMNNVTKNLDSFNATDTREEKYSISYGILEVRPETVALDPQLILNTVDQRMYTMKDAYRRSKNSQS